MLNIYSTVFGEGIIKFVSHIEKPEAFDISVYKQLLKMVEDGTYRKLNNINNQDLKEVVDAFAPYFSEEPGKALRGMINNLGKLDTAKIQKQLNRCVQCCKDAARERYWKEHLEEKQALEREMAELTEEIEKKKKEHAAKREELHRQDEEKKKEIATAEEKAQQEERTARDQVIALENAKAKIGIFKFKEKKAAQLKIDEARQEVDRIRRAGYEAVDRLKEQEGHISEDRTTNPIEFCTSI